MNIKLTAIARGVSGILAISALPGFAEAITITTPYALGGTGSQTGSVTVNGGNNTTTATNSNTNTLNTAVTQFNRDTGVLTGVTLSLTGAGGTGSATRSHTLSGSGSGGTNGTSKTIVGSGTFGQVKIGYSGTFSPNLGSAVTMNGGSTSTTGTGAYTVTNTPSAPGSVSGSINIAAATVGQFVGDGSSTTNATTQYVVSASTQRTTAGTGQFTATTATENATLSGAVAVTYTYVQHALASFDSSTTQVSQHSIDFGTWFSDDPSSSTSQNYELDNPLLAAQSSDQASLDLVNISGSGNTSVLDSGASPFTGLSAGSSTSFDAAFNLGQPVGSYTASYTLGFSDNAAGTVGNSSVFDYNTAGHSANYTLQLDLTGSIKDHATASFSSTSEVKEYTLDFGHIETGIPATLPFDIFNIGIAGQAVDLRFVSCTPISGQTDFFSIGMCQTGATVPDIAAGSSTGSTATFYPGLLLGKAEAFYNLQFVDYAPNLHGNPITYNITLHVKGIPEPGSLALLGIGLLGFGLRRRKLA